MGFREKFVQKYRNTEYFEVLPDGWVELTHKSGLSIYMHKQLRVCCLSRPYFIGSFVSFPSSLLLPFHAE